MWADTDTSIASVPIIKRTNLQVGYKQFKIVALGKLLIGYK